MQIFFYSLSKPLSSELSALNFRPETEDRSLPVPCPNDCAYTPRDNQGGAEKLI
jgi:hypothetical protein